MSKQIFLESDQIFDMQIFFTTIYALPYYFNKIVDNMTLSSLDFYHFLIQPLFQ